MNEDFSEEKGFAEEFSWYPMLYTAAKEKYLDIDKVTSSPANEFLNFINFFKRKSQLEAARIQKTSSTNRVL